MSFSDKLLGLILVLISTFILLYYTVWVIVLVSRKYYGNCFIRSIIGIMRQPFVEEGNPLFGYFLDKEYAIAIPSVLFAIGLIVVGAFIGAVLVKEGQKAKKS